MDTGNNKDDHEVSGGLANTEFSDRVTRLLITCFEGICSLLPETEALHDKLTSMLQVLKKAIRVKPVSDFAKEIQDYFVKRKLEDDFRATERDEMKQILVELTEIFKGTVSASGEFGDEVKAQLDEIQKLDSLSDMRVVKDRIVAGLQKMRDQSLSLKKELESYRQITTSLSQRLEHSQAMALVDALTNVLNRSAYDLKIGQLIRAFARHKEPAALMVVDIDYFKKINDKYGHKAGDNVLASVAASLRDTIRTSDTVFRYGGEEFVVILDRITVENAENLAEKVRKRVEKDYFVDKDLTIKVTVSIGLTGLQEGDTELVVFERADRAMYESKRKGRNKVTRID